MKLMPNCKAGRLASSEWLLWFTDGMLSRAKQNLNRVGNARAIVLEILWLRQGVPDIPAVGATSDS